MVQIIPTEKGSVILESIAWITEAQKEAIKANPKKVNMVLKDLRKDHTIAATEDGNVTSKMSVTLDYAFDVKERVTDLQECHQKFLKFINRLSDNEERDQTTTLGDEYVRDAILADMQKKNEKDTSKEDTSEEDDVKIAIIGVPVFFHLI